MLEAVLDMTYSARAVELLKVALHVAYSTWALELLEGLLKRWMQKINTKKEEKL